MNEQNFVGLAKKLVVDYFNEELNACDSNSTICEDDVYVVWLVKVLQNNKALLSTTVPDGMYYEVTYNGDKGQVYVDAYKKWKNFTVNL